MEFLTFVFIDLWSVIFVSGYYLRDGLDVLGKRVRKCNRDKLKAYAAKLSSALGDRPESWKLHDIVEMGSLIG